MGHAFLVDLKEEEKRRKKKPLSREKGYMPTMCLK